MTTPAAVTTTTDNNESSSNSSSGSNIAPTARTSSTTISPFPTPEFLEAAAVRDLILAQRDQAASQRKVQIVDVRGSDFSEGKLPGALNVASEGLKDMDRVDKLVEELMDKEMVIFHCGKSHQRGPQSAARFLSRLQAATAAAVAAGKDVGPKVYVLKGGWEGWQKQYGEEEGMVEALEDIPM
ncbi:hypothetical protein VYU27_009134 [Nannochloropsis oceanica]